ncbi:hypothetical protein NVV37_24305 [Escherichia coli]|nr:hypothetical protein [Escherichia coli]
MTLGLLQLHSQKLLEKLTWRKVENLFKLPVIIDPSHAAGMWWMVEPLAKAAVAVGADGLMIEVHNDPANAKSDGQQSIKPDKFDEIMKKVRAIAEIEGKQV